MPWPGYSRILPDFIIDAVKSGKPSVIQNHHYTCDTAHVVHETVAMYSQAAILG